MIEYVKKRLLELQDEDYRKFSTKLIPNVNNILGIKIPALRALAKELCKDRNFNTDLFIKLHNDEFMEFTMLQGIVIGLKDYNSKEFLNALQDFVPKIDNWAVCDTFCTSLKFINKIKPEIFEFITPYLKSPREYYLRFGAVILLNYFVTDEYIDRTLDRLIKLNTKDYYAQMAISWALSVCYVKYFAKTHNTVINSNLDYAILTKTIRKAIESYRVTKDQKDFLRSYLKEKTATLFKTGKI